MEDVTISEQFAWEGWLPLWQIVSLGVLVALILIIVSFLERRYASRPGAIWAFLALRLLALCLILWAMAEPTDAKTTET
ncbi:MAG: hypothetical protein AAF514_08885, partial [Verrucomicrobiota bacterium]